MCRRAQANICRNGRGNGKDNAKIKWINGSWNIQLNRINRFSGWIFVNRNQTSFGFINWMRWFEYSMKPDDQTKISNMKISFVSYCIDIYYYYEKSFDNLYTIVDNIQVTWALYHSINLNWNLNWNISLFRKSLLPVSIFFFSYPSIEKAILSETTKWNVLPFMHYDKLKWLHLPTLNAHKNQNVLILNTHTWKNSKFYLFI